MTSEDRERQMRAWDYVMRTQLERAFEAGVLGETLEEAEETFDRMYLEEVKRQEAHIRANHPHLIRYVEEYDRRFGKGAAGE